MTIGIEFWSILDLITSLISTGKKLYKHTLKFVNAIMDHVLSGKPTSANLVAISSVSLEMKSIAQAMPLREMPSAFNRWTSAVRVESSEPERTRRTRSLKISMMMTTITIFMITPKMATSLTKMVMVGIISLARRTGVMLRRPTIGRRRLSWNLWHQRRLLQVCRTVRVFQIHTYRCTLSGPDEGAHRGEETPAPEPGKLNLVGCHQYLYRPCFQHPALRRQPPATMTDNQNFDQRPNHSQHRKNLPIITRLHIRRLWLKMTTTTMTRLKHHRLILSHLLHLFVLNIYRNHHVQHWRMCQPQVPSHRA